MTNQRGFPLHHNKEEEKKGKEKWDGRSELNGNQITLSFHSCIGGVLCYAMYIDMDGGFGLVWFRLEVSHSIIHYS